MSPAIRLVPLALLLTACSPADQSPPALEEDRTSNVEDAGAQELATGGPQGAAGAHQPLLAIEGEGLRLFNRDTGAARSIAFGTPEAVTLAALEYRGEPNRSVLEECGAGPLDLASWRDGLTLYFQDSRFVGWALQSPEKGAAARLTTASGIGLGAARAQLSRAYSIQVAESTLGTEFSAGELFGLLDGPGPDARISSLWAGTSCNFR